MHTPRTTEQRLRGSVRTQRGAFQKLPLRILTRKALTLTQPEIILTQRDSQRLRGIIPTRKDQVLLLLLPLTQKAAEQPQEDRAHIRAELPARRTARIP